ERRAINLEIQSLRQLLALYVMIPCRPSRRPSQRNTSITTTFSHNVYYVQSNPAVAGTHLASIPSPAVAWSLIVRDRNLTGPWAGFSFKAGRLVTPEGRELEPQDLAWLSLLAAQAQEWRRMMEIARGGQKRPFGRAGIVDLAEVAQRRAKRSSTVMAGPDADPVAGVLPAPGPRPYQRV
ncbi:DUF3653 domain-containing protein, partial [Stenotrophomonas maltophilia]|uniref:DUF3653 domain-containing protein n=1 Tax=Stenotrophomonas maltophilia TaxID=40324 RepID=UPI003452CD47